MFGAVVPDQDSNRLCVNHPMAPALEKWNYKSYHISRKVLQLLSKLNYNFLIVRIKKIIKNEHVQYIEQDYKYFKY